MAYRKTNNRRKKWLSFCAANAALIEVSTLPLVIFQSEQSFRDYVTRGTVGDEVLKDEFPLLQLSLTAFHALEQFVDRFHFDMDNALFDDLNEDATVVGVVNSDRLLCKDGAK